MSSSDICISVNLFPVVLYSRVYKAFVTQPLLRTTFLKLVHVVSLVLPVITEILDFNWKFFISVNS